MSAKELTTKDLQILFQVGTMTIYNWRKGSTRIKPLPAHCRERGMLGERKSIFFKLGEVKKWAKDNGIDLPKENLEDLQALSKQARTQY